MGVLRLEKRQDCAPGFSWYVCSNGPGFTGCCSIDPCNDSNCPAEKLGTNLGSVSAAQKTTTATTASASKTATATASKTATASTSKTATATASKTATATASKTATATASKTATATASKTATATRPTTTTPSATTSTTPATASSTAQTSTIGSSPIVVKTSGTSVTTISLNGSTTTGLPPTAGTSGAMASQNNMGAIAGGAVGGIVFLILLVIALFCICGRKRKEHNASPPYGSVTEKHSGLFGGLFPRGRSRDSNVNSMALPDSPESTGFFGFALLKRRNNDTDHHYRDDAKVSGTSGSSPMESPGLLEVPAVPFAPNQVHGLPPRVVAELESDIVSAPSELSSASTPLYRTTRSSGSAWSPSPLSDTSDGSSTGAVLSTTRETHYSETSTAGEGQAQTQQNSNLRGGGWPGMRANLNSLRRKPNLSRTTSSGSGPGPVAPQDPDRHVLSFMEFDANPGDTRHDGVLR